MKSNLPWNKTSNIYLYLFYKQLLAFLALAATQLFFYYYNTRIFHVEGIHEWLGVIWGNITFGIATIGFMLLPYFAVNLIPFHIRWNKFYHRITEVLLYYVPVLFIIITNICDAAYYQYTYRRLSGEIFRYLGIGGHMGTLWGHFIIDYWQATLAAFVIIPLFIWLALKIHLTPRNKYSKHLLNDIVGLILGSACVVFLFRGGFGKNLEWRDTTKFCQSKNCALVTNSGYNIVRTFNGGTLTEEQYYTPQELAQHFNPVFQSIPAEQWPLSEAWVGWAPNFGHSYEAEIGDSGRITLGKDMHKNIVIIVLESFSQEYMGCYNPKANPSFTPFLDSLYQHCVVYQGRANGKKSIEGIPAIFASIPTLMTFPITLSDYADNQLNALPSILTQNGYHTAFFHGSYNGVLGFDKLCQQMGFQEYYGENEYMADRQAQKTDYDGTWGIYDEYFLQYVVRKLSSFQQPFMAGAFTLSSHHPYKMQPGHENDFLEGPHPLCRVVMYTDNALRKFFDAARKTDWYKNTVFVITADHSGQGLTREYNDYNGWYRIPMMFYLPEYEEELIAYGPEWSTHKVDPRIMQQTDIMPTILDYLGLPAKTVCFGTSAFRNEIDGWQIAYGNGYYQLETQNGMAVLGTEKEEGNGNFDLLKAIIQQYNHYLIHNKPTK